MNDHTLTTYLKIAQWAIQSNKSFEDLFLLGDTIESIIHNIDNIVNDHDLDLIINHFLNNNTAKKPDTLNKKKYNKKIEPAIIIPDIQTHPSVLLNMQIYNTTLNDAIVYETHCHSCGKNTLTGKRYCNGGCFKYVEDFNFKCFWGESCKMCLVREHYCIITRDFTFHDKHYYIDDNNFVYNQDDIKIATITNGNISFL
jgi:hypothetical protein